MYEAYITTLKNVRKHSNADRLQVAECFGNQVIVDLSYKEGDIGIYFPTDGKLGQEYAEVNNLVRKKDEDGNNIGGYLEPEKRNIKAIKLRGEKSDGLFMPLSSLASFCDIKELSLGDRITTLNGTLICEKYIPRTNRRNANNTSNKQIKKKKDIEYPLFREHIDTEQLDYNLSQFKNGDLCYITLKMHGTSQRTANLPKQNNKNFITRLKDKYLKTKYDVVTGTRRVVLETFDKFREPYHTWFKDKLQRGETVYYEVVGYINETTPIMPDGDNKKVQDKEFIKKYGDKTRFSYGCSEGMNNIYVYRMTITNEDGYVVEYPWELVKTRCEEMGVSHVPELDKFFYTTDEDLLERVDKYLDITDPIGKTHIAEGVVVRIDNKKTFKAYKKKGFFFKVLERNNKRYGRSARYGGGTRMIEVDGINLLKMMRDKKIPYGTKIYVLFDYECLDESALMKFYTIYGQFRQLHLWREEKNEKPEDVRVIDTEDLMDKKFCIMIDEDIDIQYIEELDNEKAIGLYQVIEQQNKILKAVKSLDKRLKEEQENGK